MSFGSGLIVCCSWFRGMSGKLIDCAKRREKDDPNEKNGLAFGISLLLVDVYRGLDHQCSRGHTDRDSGCARCQRCFRKRVREHWEWTDYSHVNPLRPNSQCSSYPLHPFRPSRASLHYRPTATPP